jgi:hypothetical protein
MMVTEIMHILDFTPYFSNYTVKWYNCENKPTYSHEFTFCCNIMHKTLCLK